MLGVAGHPPLEGGEVGGDAIDIEANKGLSALFAEEEGAILVGVHDEVFDEDGGAGGVVEEVEVGLLVGIGVVGAQAHAGECWRINVSKENRRISINRMQIY